MSKVLLKIIREKKHHTENIVTRGGCGTHESYKESMGYLRALRELEDETLELLKRAHEDPD